MVFTSTFFLLVFLPLFLIIYHITPSDKRNWVALFSSLIFYAWGAPLFIFLLLFLLIANFFLVKRMDKELNNQLKATFLVLSLLINLSVLIYFKYSNFIVDNTNLLLSSLGVDRLDWTEVVLPIGISFFTFQSITYTLDVFWKKHDPLNKLRDYLLYILLFPQLIAGPIIRFNTIAKEIEDRESNNHLDFKLEGVYLFIIGLSKKVLIANQVGELVDVFFEHSGGLSSYYAWIGIVAYSIQIYFDFSGYSDMAIGLGKIMGFNFPENFKNPYTSSSITEFWKRWHITLGTFMRDYLYIPLGGNRSESKLRQYSNLIIVFLLSGLWHGASWNFIIWGAWHGTFLILERVFLNKILQKIPAVVSILYTYIVVLVGWVFFRSETFSQAINYLNNLVGVTSMDLYRIDINNKFYFFLILGITFSFITLLSFGKRIERFMYYTTYTIKEHLLVTITTFVLLIVSVSYIAASGFNPFIYFRF